MLRAVDGDSVLSPQEMPGHVQRCKQKPSGGSLGVFGLLTECRPQVQPQAYIFIKNFILFYTMLTCSQTSIVT